MYYSFSRWRRLITEDYIYLAVYLEARQREIVSLGGGVLACLLDPEMPDLVFCLDAPGPGGPGISKLVIINMLPQCYPVNTVLTSLQLPAPYCAPSVT